MKPVADNIPATSRQDLGTMAKDCPTHGGFMSTGTRYVLGTYFRDIWSECGACKADRDGAERNAKLAGKAAEQRAQLESMLGQTMIPARFHGRTFESYRAEGPGQREAMRICQEFARDFDRGLKQGASLVLSGKPGTGKSHLAAAILQAIMPRHVGAYMTLMDMVRAVRDTWRRDSEISESQLLRKLTEFPLLVIDEIGVQYGTDGERAIVFDVMDRRYREMRPTILMTNLDKDAFREAVGDRVYDRLTEVGRWIPFDWDSYRPQARKELRDAA